MLITAGDDHQSNSAVELLGDGGVGVAADAGDRVADAEGGGNDDGQQGRRSARCERPADRSLLPRRVTGR